jgi:protein-disulfide isomerase
MYVRETLPQIVENYVATGKVLYIFIDYPLTIHAQAQLAAEAAECAGQQGKFWAMHDQLYLNQSDWADNDGALSVFLGYARTLGLDQTAYQTCLGNHEMLQRVQADYAFGQSVQVPSTPAFVIAGKGMTGAQPYSTFQQVIDAALK